MTKIEKVLYTAKVHTTGGRDGAPSALTATWTLSYHLRPHRVAPTTIRSNSSPPVGQPVSSAPWGSWPAK